MSKILELREKRAKVWEAAKAFLDSKRGNDGLLSPEDTATYEKMEADVIALGKEIERLERQAAIDLELSKPLNIPITDKPTSISGNNEKTGRASDEYRQSFWNMMRGRRKYDVHNALQIGEDTEGGYLVPDDFERTLVEALEEENIFRQIANVITTPRPTVTIFLRPPRLSGSRILSEILSASWIWPEKPATRFRIPPGSRRRISSMSSRSCNRGSGCIIIAVQPPYVVSSSLNYQKGIAGVYPNHPQAHSRVSYRW
jgi:hypothetical protein